MNSQKIEFSRLRYLADRLAAADEHPALPPKQQQGYLIQASKKPLNSPEIIEAVARRITRLFSQGDTANAQILLKHIAEGTLSPAPAIKEQSLISLSLLSENARAENHKEMLSLISQSLVRWLEQETELLSGYDFICSQLAACLEKLISMGCYQHVSYLTPPIKDITTGTNKKQKIQHQCVSRVFNRITQTHYLEQLTDSYLGREPEQTQAAKSLLTVYGSKSTPYLLEILKENQIKKDRFMLLEILQNQGQEAISPLLSCLHSRPPWYLIRNIILLISLLKDETLYSHVKPYLSHEDIRVQQEVVHFLATMDKTSRTDRLLEAVTICGDETKPQIIRILSPLKEARVHKTMQGIIKNIETCTPTYREKILAEAGSYILSYPDNNGKVFLEKLLAQDNSTHRLQEATKIALKKLMADSGESQDPVCDKPESAVQLDEGATDKNSLVKNHITHHSSFYTALSRKECKTLYKSFISKTYEPDDIIVKKGDVHSYLYFLEQGEVSLDFEEESITDIMPLQPGDIFGYEVFMDGSEWPVTLRATERSTLFLFDQEELLKLQQKDEHISATFMSYCRQKDCMLSFLKNTRSCILQQEKDVIPFDDAAGELISTITTSGLFSNGISCCFHLPRGIDHSLFAKRHFSVTFTDSEQKVFEVKGYTAGLIFHEQPERLLRIMIKFAPRILTPVKNLQCSAISLVS